MEEMKFRVKFEKNYLC